MITISTKQLRQNMAQVVRDLQNGATVQLSYRHKIIGVLEPVAAEPAPERRGSASAIQRFLNSADFGTISPILRQSNRSFKQELADLRERDINQEKS